MSTDEESNAGWYVIRTKPKNEHIAAAHLMRFALLDDVFSPRIRFQKATRTGKKWFVEALFPGYIFARFDLFEKLRTVNASSGVTGVLKFSDKYPQISDPFIQQLRGEFPEDDQSIRVIDRPLQEGDEVLILDGAMKGLETIVTKVMSGRERVRILLNWLGEEREAEVSYSSISPTREARRDI